MTTTAESFHPDSTHLNPYGREYYFTAEGVPQGTFALKPDLTLPRAQALAETAQLSRGAQVLDYGCGLGAMTAAFNRLGYEATGLDPSPCAVENALSEARGLVQQLGHNTLACIDDNAYDLVVAKDVFEHIPEHEIPSVTKELLRIARQLLLVIPTVGKDRKFIFPLYENDPTHITRLTRPEWLGFLACVPGCLVTERPDLTPRIRRADKISGTLCAILEATDNEPRQQQTLLQLTK